MEIVFFRFGWILSGSEITISDLKIVAVLRKQKMLFYPLVCFALFSLIVCWNIGHDCSHNHLQNNDDMPMISPKYMTSLKIK